MKVRTFKNITVEGRVLPPSIYNLWSDWAKQAIDRGDAIDLEGNYIRKGAIDLDGAIIEKRKRKLKNK